jgi:hypothetical protein
MYLDPVAEYAMLEMMRDGDLSPNEVNLRTFHCAPWPSTRNHPRFEYPCKLKEKKFINQDLRRVLLTNPVEPKFSGKCIIDFSHSCTFKYSFNVLMVLKKKEIPQSS